MTSIYHNFFPCDLIRLAYLDLAINFRSLGVRHPIVRSLCTLRIRPCPMPCGLTRHVPFGSRSTTFSSSYATYRCIMTLFRRCTGNNAVPGRRNINHAIPPRPKYSTRHCDCCGIVLNISFKTALMLVLASVAPPRPPRSLTGWSPLHFFDLRVTHNRYATHPPSSSCT